MKNSDFLLMFVLGLLLCNTQVLGDIPVGEAPSWMKFSPDGELAFVTLEVPGQIEVIDVSSQQSIERIQVDGQPFGLAFSPDGNFLYVTCASGHDNTIWCIDTESFVAEELCSVGSNPTGLVVSHDSQFLYVSRYTAGDVAVVSTQSGDVVQYINTARWPFDIQWSPDGQYIWVMNDLGNSISIIDPSSNQVIRSIEGINRPSNLAFSSDGREAYVTSPNNDVVYVFSVESYQLITTIDGVGDGPSGIEAYGDKVYVVSVYSAELLTIDTESYQVVERTDLNDVPQNVEANPVTEELYVSVRIPNENGYIYVQDCADEEPGYGIPFYTGFENGINGFIFRSPYDDNIPSLVDDPVFEGNHSAGTFADPNGHYRYVVMQRHFDHVEGVEISVWFNMEHYGMGDARNNWGAGMPGQLRFADWRDGPGEVMHINASNDGRVRWIYSPGQDYDNYVSNVRLDLHTWYQYRVKYIDGTMELSVYNEAEERLIHDTIQIPDFQVNYVDIGSGYIQSPGGFTYWDNLSIEEYTGDPNICDLPVYEDFETGLDGWWQFGDPGNDAVIVNDPVFGGNHALGCFATDNHDWNRNNCSLRRDFYPVDGFHSQAWFYLNQYGMGDNPGSWGAGSGTLLTIGHDVENDGHHFYISIDHEGRVRVLSGPNPYTNYIGDARLELHTWYRYDIYLYRGVIEVGVYDVEGNLIVNSGLMDLVELNQLNLFQPEYISFGAYCLLNDDFTYYDNISIEEFTREPAPEISIAPNSIDFGEVPVNGESSQQLTISNEGDSELTIEDFVTDSPFYVNLNFPQYISPNEELIFDMLFLPEDYGEFSFEATVISNDPDESTVAIQLNGIGAVRDNPWALDCQFENNLTNTGWAENPVLESGSETYADGVTGRALLFDGNTGYEIPNSQTWMNGDFSFDTRVYIAESGLDRFLNIFSNYWNSDNGQQWTTPCFEIFYQGNHPEVTRKFRVYMRHQAGQPTVHNMWSLNEVNEPGWYRLTVRRTDGHLEFFVNRELQDEIHYNGNPQNGYPLHLGMAVNVNKDSKFHGKIEYARISDQAVADEDLFAQVPFGLPFSDTFEYGLSGWHQIGRVNNDAIIVDGPVFDGEHSVACFSNRNLAPFDRNLCILQHNFNPVDGVEVEVWFNMEQYGMGDNTGSWGSGDAAIVDIATPDNSGFIRIAVNNDGRVRWIPRDPRHDYDNYVSQTRLNLNTWYRYHIIYLNGILEIAVYDVNESLVLTGRFDAGELHEVNDFSVECVRIGSHCLAADGYTYYDNFSVKEAIYVPQPQISITPDTLDFSDVLIGEVGSLPVTIGNNGDADLTVTGISENEVFFTDMNFPRVISAGNNLEIAIQFRPDADGEFNFETIVSSNDPGANEIPIHLSGTGLTPLPEIEVSPAEIRFEPVEVGGNDVIQMLIYNRGRGDLEISGVLNINREFRVEFNEPYIIPPGESNGLNVEFSPTLRGLSEDVITINSNDPDNPEILIPVSGIGLASDIQFSPQSIDFGQVEVGSTQSQVLTIDNIGNFDLNVFEVTIEGLCFRSDFDSTVTIAPGENHIFNLNFTPDIYGEFSSTITLTSNDPFNPQTQIPATGIGMAPDITVMPEIIEFGNVFLLETEIIPVTISNEGNDDLIIPDIHVGDFPFSVDFQGEITLSPGASQEVDVTFSPINIDNFFDVLTIISNDPDEAEATCELSGTGNAPAIEINSQSLAFGSVIVFEEEHLTLTISNSGTYELEVIDIHLTGDYYSFDNAAQFTIPAGSDLEIELTFAPELMGDFPGTLSILSNDPYNSHVDIQLSGIGIAPVIVLDQETLPFGDVLIPETGNLTVLISNDGTSNLTVFDITIDSVSFASDFSETITIAPGGNQSVVVSFTPETYCNYEGTLMIVSDDPFNNPVLIPLYGRGLAPDITIDPEFLDFGEVEYWRSRTLPVSFSNIGNIDLIISEMIIEGEFYAFDFIEADTVQPGGSTEVLVTITANDCGDLPGEITIFSNDPDEGEVTVDIITTGIWVDHEELVGRVIVDIRELADLGILHANKVRPFTSLLNNAMRNIIEENEEDAVGQIGAFINQVTAAIRTRKVTPEAGEALIAEANFILALIDELGIDEAEGLLGAMLRELPEEFYLSQNFPNPFNSTTTINFGLPEASRVKLIIYDLFGRTVNILTEDNFTAGHYSLTWNANDVPTGLYIIRMESRSSCIVRKVTLIR